LVVLAVVSVAVHLADEDVVSMLEVEVVVYLLYHNNIVRYFDIFQVLHRNQLLFQIAYSSRHRLTKYHNRIP
jgi:hypothetical protein